MSTTTTNYGLIKPDTTDPILIGQLNDNSDAIDAALKENADAIESKQDALTTFQLDAVNSGINSAKVEQIATNASDISDIETLLGGKVDKETGKGLSTNDFTTAEKTKLDDLAEIKSIGTGLNLDDNGELTATGGGSGGTTNYNDLSNKPQINGNTLSGNKTSAQLGLASTSDIPTVPITAIQKNGTGITPVSGTVNITVPTQASDINAATATQGDKADTAIQGIKVNNSTVNPDSNKVVSIAVPTTAADVSALPNTTKYAAALSLTINSSTYVITGQLKDQNGDNLGAAQTIDLPLESVVVGGSYNSQTKKVVLTLQNGNTIEFSVADLVSGLQTELSASNKLNPAYINYDSTHRAVSDTEKSTWNGKQSALTTAQLAAANSGIDSTKVEQIETNKNNISSIKEKTDNIMIDSNRNIYIRATAPTGTIPVGSTWISGGSLKGYVQESNVSTATIEQGTFNADGSESPNNNRVRTTFDTDIYSMGAYTVSITGANDVLVFVYDSDKTCIQSEGSNGWKSLPYSFNLAGDRYVRFAFRKTYDAAISPSDVSNYALAFQGWK